MLTLLTRALPPSSVLLVSDCLFVGLPLADFHRSTLLIEIDRSGGSLTIRAHITSRATIIGEILQREL